MKVFLLISGSGWDTSIGKVEAVFAHHFNMQAELIASHAITDYVNNRGGRFRWKDVPPGESPKLSGWELVCVSQDGGNTFRYRKDGKVTEQFVAIRTMEAKS